MSLMPRFDTALCTYVRQPFIPMGMSVISTVFVKLLPFFHSRTCLKNIEKFAVDFGETVCTVYQEVH